MALELVLPIITELIKEPFKKYIAGPVARHITYAFRCDSKVETLQHQVENLNNKRLRLQQSVDDATRNGEQIFPDVTKWLTTAGKDIEDAEKLIQEKAQAMNKCFLGLCPDLKTRYQLSKKAHKKALAVSKQLQDAQAVPDPISYCPPLQQIVEQSVYGSESLPSRVLILNQIMDALRDPKLHMIGVYGMGGVGKTMLAKEVKGKAIQEKKLFETVVMVAVSQTPDLRRIQGEIADSLGLKFDVEEIPGRACQLHRRLEKAKVLIILDDVWQKLDLNAVGVPSGDAYESCKMLLTSRRKEVLCNEMRTQKDFSLDVLKEEETWSLFEMSISNITNPSLRCMATEIAKKCAGLPLLILKVAADLRNKESYAWSDMLSRLSSLENTEIYEKVHKVIESSYENLLDVEAKSLFLLCSLFGESNISIHKLLMYSVGLGLFKHTDSIEGSRNRVLTLIDKLRDECLLLDDDMFEFVKIHDVVRDIALVITSRVHHAFVGANKVRLTDFQNKDCSRISLPNCDICELPGVLECPEAELFSLFSKGDYLRISGSFFEGVPKLKVVDFTGVCFVSGVPSSLGFLRGLQTLCLQRCKFYNVAVVADLKQLEVLSLSGSEIKELPGEIKGLTRLKLLDLRDCYNLKVIPRSVLSNLSLLEELYMFRCFVEWEAEGNASLVELKNLSHLTTLEIQVKDDRFLPQDWFFSGVQNYRISIGESWDRFNTLRSRRILKLELETSIGLIHRIKEFVRGTEVLELHNVKGVENLLCDFEMEKTDFGQHGIYSFGKLQILRITGCHSLKSLFSHSFVKYFPQLQEVTVSYCSNIQAIAGEGCRDEEIEFTQLTSLSLFSLPNLISFWETSGTVSFPSLTRLRIYGCDGLKYVFTNSMVKSLEQLKELEIERCDSMEEIILSEEIEEENIIKIVFPKLDSLQLLKLENLKKFSSRHPIDFLSLRELKIHECGAIENLVSKFCNRSNKNESVDECLFNELVTFPNLEELSIDGIDRLMYIWSEEINGSALNLKNLQSVLVCNCPDMKYAFPASVACGLPQLRMLGICYCGVEVIIGSAKVETSEIKWPSLTVLQVWNCPNMIGISANNSKVTFPNLEHLYIVGVDKLKYVFPASMACCLLQLRELDIRESGVEVIIENAEEETIEIEWPNLTLMKVLDCCKLIKFGTNNSKLLPKLEVLELDHHSLKALQSDVLPVDFSWKLKEVTLNNLRVKGNISNMLFGFLRRINSLEHLIFTSSCLNLDDILSFGDERKVRDHKQKYHLTLEHLELRYITNLKHILKKDSQFHPILRHLHSIAVTECGDLMNITPSSASFQNLTALKVEGCKKMTSLVTASTAKTMVQLAELRVSSCKMMEEIVTNDDSASCTEHDVIIFEKMELLELIDLDRLNSFCSGNYRFDFPLLEQVTVSNCSTMKIFCSGILNTPKLHGIKVDYQETEWKPFAIGSCQEEQWDGDLNATIRGQLKEWVGELILPNEMKFFRRLKKLILRDCNWVEVVFNLEGLSVKGGLVGLLPHLSELELINLPKLTQLCNGDPGDILDLRSLMVLKIENCSRLEYALTKSMSSRLYQLCSIEVKNYEMMKTIIMKEEEADYSGRGDLECPSLKMLTIWNCPSIKAFISRRTKKEAYIHLGFKVFSNLRELFLDINSIKAILQSELPSKYFSKVNKLGLGYASSPTTEFHVPLLHFLPMIFNLDRLEVCHSSVKELFKFQEIDSNFRKEAMMTLPQISGLKLYDLDDMTHIWWQNSEFHASLFQNLEWMQVLSCGQITSIASSSASFRNLRGLYVDGCNQLRYLMTSSVVKSMVQLSFLKVESCKMLTEIVGDGNDGTKDEIIFTFLRKLELSNLQSLTSFSLGQYAFQLPCLRKVIVRKCPNWRIFCPGIIVAPMLSFVKAPELKYPKKYYWEGDLNTTIEHIYENLLVGFLGVENVKLSMFPILKEKWTTKFPFKKLCELKRLEVDDCEQFTRAISSHLLPHLSNLEVLIVENCTSVEQVFDLEEVMADQQLMQSTIFKMETLNELHLIDLPRLGNIWSKDPHEILSFENLQLLKLQNCGSLTCIFNLSVASSLPNLQHLEVFNCSMVEYIIAKAEDETMQRYQMIFPSLQTMKLKCLSNLLMFHSTSGLLEFMSLTFIEVVECKKMGLFSSIFSSKQGSCSMNVEEKVEKIGALYGHSVAPLLRNMIVIPKLEKLRVEWKNLMDYLNDENQFLSGLRFIDLTGFKDISAIFPSNVLQNFPNLEKLTLSDASMEEMNLDELCIIDDKLNGSVGLSIKLKLSNLPKLKHLVCDDSQLVPLFQILVELEVCECSRLQILVPSLVSFQNLTALEAWKCYGMKNLISASTARSLVQLRKMKVRHCKTMREIVAVASDEEEYEIRFSQLAHLELDGLPCLTSFCSGNYVFHFPSLEEVLVKECPIMKTFSAKVEITPKLKKVKTGRREYEREWEGNLNNTILSLFLNKVFSNLEELYLDIKSIKAILQFELPSNFFPKVKRLRLEYNDSCSTTKLHVSLFHFLSMAFNLHQLEVCHSSVKELFKFQGLNISFKEEAMRTLSRIRELKLNNLYDLRNIWLQISESCESLFHSLEILQVLSCGQIICLASSTASFQNMKILEVDGCNHLRYMMSSSVSKSMFQLETLRVKSCKMLMEIMGDGNHGTTDMIIFNKLNTLELSNLQSLTCFSSGHYAFQFPCLVNVVAFNCPNLTIFCHGFILAPVLSGVQDSKYYGNYYWEGDLNTTIKHMYKNLLVGLEHVVEVRLSIFPILKEKWAAQFPFNKLRNLKRLEVDDCAQFTSAISSHLLPHLSNLGVLIVDKCNSVEQIFDLEEVNDHQYLMANLTTLQLFDLQRLTNVWSKDPRKILSFANLEVLKVQNCDNLTCIFNLSRASWLPKLQYVEVINCSSVEYVIAKEDDETMGQYQTIFPSLQTMKLKCLTKLLSFYSTSGILECPFLKSIEVVGCPNMELSSSTFSKVQDLCSMTAEEREWKIGTQYGDSIVPLLGNSIVIPLLEELKVESNNMTIYLKDNNSLLSRLRFIELTGFEDEYAIVPCNVLQNFPNLERLTLSDALMEEMNIDDLCFSKDEQNDSVGLSLKLKLSNLPKLKHLVLDDSHLVPLFQILVELEVCECSRLQILVPSSVSFQNLTALQVSKCDGMKHLISASTARSLLQLKRMNVMDCEMIQEIVAVVSDAEEYEIRFSQLENLELDDLPCLTSFSSGNYVFHFPSLEDVMVKGCPAMKNFAGKVEITPKLEKVKTGRREYEWEWEGSLNVTIQSLFMDKED